MSSETPPLSDAKPDGSPSLQAGPGSVADPHRNGAATEPSADQAGAAENPSGMKRAEAIVDGVADRMATFASSAWGKKVLTFAAHVREAVQDFWAEVQDVRRGKPR